MIKNNNIIVKIQRPKKVFLSPKDINKAEVGYGTYQFSKDALYEGITIMYKYLFTYPERFSANTIEEYIQHTGTIFKQLRMEEDYKRNNRQFNIYSHIICISSLNANANIFTDIKMPVGDTYELYFKSANYKLSDTVLKNLEYYFNNIFPIKLEMITIDAYNVDYFAIFRKLIDKVRHRIEYVFI